MLYLGYISCVLGFGGLVEVAVVNAVFRDISCVLGVFGTSDLGFGQKWSKSHFLGKMVKKSTFGLAVLEVLRREQRVNAVFREHFMCVGVLDGLRMEHGLMLYSGNISCVLWVFVDPRIWVWSKWSKSDFLGPAMPHTAKIMTFGETS